ncbi:ABC transporter substrate-binding protein [Teichococcus cervicalis]|uniref:Receptor family ligand-binding protein n=1 Tax=Pseudoroseomonas cervicalis ATCC 49957 TaxID=525371 RepID=D5RGV5_9PROT|nr:ABC transporter substrate-binding protein [Pseudoroseomonas cervicalis]EFH13467.1 receptor family ligand-binding protein [Pseudoroseomonas cervicalis ATCC 49957]
MMMRSTRRLALGLLAGLGLGLSATAAQAELRLGALYPFSGELAVLGDESWRGLELAVEERNAAGGIRGERIVLVRGDAVDNNQAVAEARRLISVSGVKAIFGTYSSARSQVASQVAELARIPYFEMGAVSDAITERRFRYLFRTNPTARDMAARSIEMVVNAVAPGLSVDPKALRVAIIHEDSLYGTTVGRYQSSYAREQGLNVVETLPYPANIVDMSSLILRLQNARVDVVLQTSYQNDTVLFFRQAREANFRPRAIIGGGGGYSLRETMQAVGQDVIDGALNIDFTQYAINPQAAPGIEEFVAAYRAKYGMEPRSGHSLGNYVGAKVFLDAIAAARSFSADDIRTAVAAVDVPDGQTAEGWGVKFGPDGQNERARMMGMQWQDGRLVTVFPPEAAVSALRLRR